MTDKKWDIARVEDMKYFTKLLEPEEKLICSMDIIKINDRKNAQKRVFVLTNKAIYNFSKSDLRRKIQVGKITGIINSRLSNEFTVHVESEYDYLFVTDKKEDIFRFLRRVFRDLTKKKLPFFEVKEASLFQYCQKISALAFMMRTMRMQAGGKPLFLARIRRSRLRLMTLSRKDFWEWGLCQE